MRPDTIKAAFVLLYDASLAGKRHGIHSDLEASIAAVRRSLSLSRKEAQEILRQTFDRGNEHFTAALVLAYEGIGIDRVEPDFTFSRADVEVLTAIRASTQMSLKRASEIVQAYQQGQGSSAHC
jgi:hypothetical protein